MFNASGPRYRAPQTVCMWTSADYYAMTGLPPVAEAAPGKVRTTGELTVGQLPNWMLHRV